MEKYKIDLQTNKKSKDECSIMGKVNEFHEQFFPNMKNWA